LMPLIAARLAPGGLFVYSIETLEQGRYKLQTTGRFAHTTSYVEELGRKAGLEPVVSKSVLLRNEQGKAVTGAVAILRRVSGA
jgi:predicted TPR repeat methyltransferase